ncbi:MULTISPECIES: DUF397 domain-containing protein [Streptomyces]|uniref:DUF397 domain-containing protein n=1 Tax=Streptomyces TaxID=1883 RepID=UPI00298DA478|nr:DUF397 domain-containing protein [Streptomyces canus]
MTWRKSSYSNPDGGECLEVSDALPSRVPVRDGKDPGRRALVFSDEAWSVFVAHVSGS